MVDPQAIHSVVDLTDSERNLLYHRSNEEARRILRDGTAEDVRNLDGHFALVAVKGKTVRMTRSLGRPMRYFVAKLADGPCLIVAERMDEIFDHLRSRGLVDQFHPSYTRMVPAHYITELKLLGCPDPNPTYERFFAPEPNRLEGGTEELGRAYVRAVYAEILKWLEYRAASGPIGVCFSGGIDSGSVFLLTYHALLTRGESPARLKAFTLAAGEGARDLEQARSFLGELGLELFLEVVEVPEEELDWRQAVRAVEDYKPLDIEAATMGWALCRGIRRRYPEWRYLIDGDGGDENLKDYPIEENPELTIRSVLNNLMLYQEGWGVDSIKHSLTYTGGLSRSYTRTYAPAALNGFDSFSPYTLPNVIIVAEAIPFVELTDWQPEALYRLKGEIVAAGVREVTGLEMPVFAKRRFQHGVGAPQAIAGRFPQEPTAYRRAFHALYESTS